MRTEIIMAGFGGQGVLLAGQILALAGMASGRHVTWLPSYGAEMRGGTANCSVVISDQPIGAPMVERADLVLAFNQPSVDTFIDRVAPGGHLVYNSSLAVEPADRFDLEITGLPATELAAQLGGDKTVNMIMLGAAAALTGLAPRESLIEALTAKFTGAKQKLVPLNIKALELGREAVANPHRPPEVTSCLMKTQTNHC